MVFNQDGTGREPYTVWGLTPENIHRNNTNAKEIVNFVAAVHPDHYPTFIAVVAKNSLYGDKLLSIFGPVLTKAGPYNPRPFWDLLIPGAIEKLLEDNDDGWHKEWKLL